MSIFDLGRDGEASATCSSAGCRAAAAWTIAWRNPRIHDASRVKEWAACDEHREHLRAWLESRDMPVTVAPFGTRVERVG
ncbi:hypothetical protein [Agrococcus sp. SGAir0287]|uniref:hypothetical protein n=1 Tax=Agrococcus sp. SGAir0287 TaxID=2070347 RepID=UPI0010CCFCA3|nr:hypothetical protein [Agrococcus sp. SGAir0287]QCR19238.1 hypothetical protein C1N71_07185 [Agrococcus sp. SGAir0287]